MELSDAHAQIASLQEQLDAAEQARYADQEAHEAELEEVRAEVEAVEERCGQRIAAAEEEQRVEADKHAKMLLEKALAKIHEEHAESMAQREAELSRWNMAEGVERC